MTHSLIIAIGSNHNIDANLKLAQSLLQKAFHHLRYTQWLQTQPIKTSHCHVSPDVPFVNLLAYGQTDMDCDHVLNILKECERACGNTTTLRSEGKVPVDIDLMLLGKTRYHEADWQRPYIQQLMRMINDKT